MEKASGGWRAHWQIRLRSGESKRDAKSGDENMSEDVRALEVRAIDFVMSGRLTVISLGF